MNIIYNDTKKDLPVEQLHHLFLTAGWSSEDIPEDWLQKFNIPFINSTIVISAWDNEHLVGVVRVLSDKLGRSIIYDLVVEPKYKGKGIGTELVKRCIAHYPNSEWLVGCLKDVASFYEKVGFQTDKNTEVFLSIPSIYQ
ncbi:MAG: GNAT family N-acetyltransferase [Defluviitaleaceae bacterium]|nr:GNAT family N-acetyltransferase [Defluviitaleaceae bacterium]